MTLGWLPADWPAPAHIKAGTTLRHPGDSEGPYASLNLGDHVGDAPLLVVQNRRLLRQGLALPSEPCWLNQVHGTEVVRLLDVTDGRKITADGAWTSEPNIVAAVLTADCLPILLTDQAGTEVAAVHAGWRGLQAGVLQNAVAAMSVPANQLLAWLGPAISQRHFEVGEEVRAGFVAASSAHEDAFCASSRHGHWMADIYTLAKNILRQSGVHAIFGADHCTYHEAGRFFSYRRDKRCGRQASLIWIDVSVS